MLVFRGRADDDTIAVSGGTIVALGADALENPERGVCLPDDLPHDEILAHARPYLGPFISRTVDWTPLQRWSDPFAGYGRPRPDDEDVWQFSTFLVTGP